MRLANFGRRVSSRNVISLQLDTFVTAHDTGNRTNPGRTYKIYTALLFFYCDQIINVIFQEQSSNFYYDPSLYEIHIASFVILF